MTLPYFLISFSFGSSAFVAGLGAYLCAKKHDFGAALVGAAITSPLALISAWAITNLI